MNKYLFVILLLVLSIPALYNLFPGFYEPHDLHHLADIYEMFRATIAGQIPPRLGPDFSFGYGYPLFNFYYVLPFYLGVLFYFLLGSLTLSFKFVFLISIIVSLFGMYLFLREFVGKFATLTGSILFLFTPYRAVQIYVRGAMGEALALSLLPFVAWAIVRLIRNPKLKNVALTSLIIALFIVSHNYFFVLAFPLLATLLLLFYFLEKDKSKILKLSIISGVLATSATAFWWLPAIIEQNLVRSITPFPLIDHFPFIKQLVLPSWGYGSSVWGPDDMISFQIGIVNLSVIILSMLFFIFWRGLLKDTKVKIIFLWALGGFFISVFFMNIRSLPLWKLLPFYNLIQFPWRLLNLTTFLSAIIAAILIHLLPKKIQTVSAFVIIALAMLTTFSYFRPSKIVYTEDQSYLVRFFGDKNYSEDYLLLPKWVEIRPQEYPKSKIESIDAEVSGVIEVNPVRWQAKVSAKTDSKITFNSYYFPGWYARVDGVDTKIATGKPFGQIEIEVSGGEHIVQFYWKETPLRKVADLMSLISVGLITVILIKKDAKSATKN